MFFFRANHASPFDQFSFFGGSFKLKGLPSSIPPKWHFEDYFPFPKVGYVNSLEGTTLLAKIGGWYIALGVIGFGVVDSWLAGVHATLLEAPPEWVRRNCHILDVHQGFQHFFSY